MQLTAAIDNELDNQDTIKENKEGGRKIFLEGGRRKGW